MTPSPVFGAIEWMKSQGIPITRDNPGARVIRFGDDGVYYTQQFSTQITVEMDGETAYGQGVAVPAAGRWSIAGGRLAVCQDSGGMSGTVTKGSVTMPISAPGAGTLLQGYSCSETRLTTSLDMGGSTMGTTYSKIFAQLTPENKAAPVAVNVLSRKTARIQERNFRFCRRPSQNLVPVREAAEFLDDFLVNIRIANIHRTGFSRFEQGAAFFLICKRLGMHERHVEKRLRVF